MPNVTSNVQAQEVQILFKVMITSKEKKQMMSQKFRKEVCQIFISNDGFNNNTATTTYMLFWLRELEWQK